MIFLNYTGCLHQLQPILNFKNPVAGIQRRLNKVDFKNSNTDIGCFKKRNA